MSWYHNGLLWAGLLLVIIIGGFMISFQTYKPSKYKEVSYNHFDFIKAAGLWSTDWQKNNVIYTLRLRYNPLEVENVSVSGYFDPAFNRQKIYVTFDPNSGNFTTMSLAAAELSVNMVQALGATPIAACTTNVTDVCEGLPIVNCGDINTSVIWLRGGGDPAVAARGECIMLLGEGFNLLRSTDRLLYTWYKIMDVDTDLK